MNKITKSRFGIYLFCAVILALLVVNATYTQISTSPDENVGVLASPSDISIEQVQRTIQVSEFGLVTIHENVTVRNVGSSPLNGCEICHPQTHDNKIAQLMAYDYDNNTQLKISESYTRNRETFRAVFFAKSIQSEERYQFKLTTAYADCVSLDSAFSSYYSVHLLGLEVPLYPKSPYPIEKITIQVEFFDYLEVPQAFGYYSPHADFIKDEVLYYERFEVKANHLEMLTIWYYSELPPAHFTSATRTIEFDPWGYIHVTEKQTLKNIGMDFSYIDQLPFCVPTDAINVRAHDDLGNLTLAVFQPDEDYEGPPLEQLNGTVFTRVQISGNHSYTFTLSYTLNLENHTTIEHGRYLLSTQLYTLMNIQINTLDVNLILPEGCRLEKNHSCNTTDSYLDYTRRVYRLITDERGAAINSDIYLNINVPIISMSMRPLFIAFMIGIIATALISLRTIDRIILPAKIPVPKGVREVIERFCRQYELRIAYRIGMGRLSRQKRLREIEKDRYIRERGKLTHKLDKIENELAVVKTEMSGLGEKYQNIITMIEQKEEERTRAREMTITALKSYRNKDIHKKAFDRIVKEQRTKIRTADNEIDRFLLALREEYL